MDNSIIEFNNQQSGDNKKICELLSNEIIKSLPNAEYKIWHGAPVWFLDGNPIVGYDVLKSCVRLLFWSGQSFEEEGLSSEGSFKAAGAKYTDVNQINTEVLQGWLAKSKNIQWDYKNIVKRRGELIRIK